MKTEKKAQQKYFEAFIKGRKLFEVRLADFNCKPGDTLVFKEQKEGTKKLAGRKAECEVLYKFNTKHMEKFHTKEDIEKFGFVYYPEIISSF